MMDQAEIIHGLRAQLAEREEQHRRSEQVQTALYEIADAASAVTDMQAFYAKLHDIVGHLMYARNFFIALLDRKAGMLSWPYHVDEKDPGEWPPSPYKDEKTATSYVLRTGRTLRGGPQSAKLLEQGELGFVGTWPEDAILVPLTADGRTFGVLAIQGYERGIAYSDQDVQLLEFVAQHIATALTRARAIEETIQRNNELSIINSIQQGLASKLDLQAIIDLVGDRVREIFDFEVGGIALYDQPTETMTLSYVYARVDGKSQRISPGSMPLGGFSGQAIRTGHTVLVNENLNVRSAEVGSGLVGGDEMPKSGVYVPIRTAEKVLGIVTLQSYARENAFSDADVRLLETLASSMSVALENARLFDQTQHLLKETEHRAAELSVINSVQKGLASKLDMQAIYDLVGDQIRDIFKTEVVYIAVRNSQDPNQIDFPYFLDRGSRLMQEPLVLGEGMTSRVIEAQQPLLVASMPEQMALGAIFSQGEQSESYLGVPIAVGSEIIGVASVQSYNQNAFGGADVRLLSTLASSMGVALENARLFDQTQRLLRETEQRAAELSVINSVQQGLASKLDMQSIYELVGEKIRDIFHSESMFIMTYDKATNLCSFPYNFEQGNRYHPNKQELKGISGYVIGTRQPVLINTDLPQQEAALIGAPSVVLSGEDIKARLDVPLLVGDEATGVISLQSVDRENLFSESDLRLLQTLASSMSVALENARLFEETQRLLKETEQRAAELAIINSVQEGLASKLEMQGIYELVGEKIRQVFDAQVVSIMTYDPSTDLLRERYSFEKGDRTVVPDTIPSFGFRKHVIQTREPLVINRDAEKARREFGNAVLTGVAPKSNVFVPLIAGELVTGVVSLQNLDREDAFSDSDVRLLQTLANSMSVALENARLLDETQRLLKESEQHNAELSAIGMVSQALVAETDLDKTIQLIGQKLREIFNPDIFYVALLDRAAGVINFPYAHGDDFPPLAFGEGLTSKIIQTGKPLLINQDLEKKRAELGTQRVGRQAASYLGVPIVAGGQSIGVISVQSTMQENAFDEDDLRLLGTIAANAGAAIRNAQLHAETQRRAQEMATLAEIGRDISSSLEPTVVLEKIAARAKELLSASSSAVYLVNPDRRSMRPITTLGELAEELKVDVIDFGVGIIGTLAQQGRAEFINDTNSDPRAVLIPGTETVTNEHLMAAPLFRGEEVMGMMAVWRTSDDPFDDADLNFLVGLSRQAGIALENARLFDEIKRQGQYLETIFTNSPVAIVTVDSDGRVLSWSPAAERMFGFSRGEALGKEANSLLADSDAVRAEAMECTRRAISGEYVYSLTRRTRKDGGMIDVDLAALPLLLEGGKRGVVAIYHDITELQRARREAVAANEAKSAFLATMSHEIRTPMNAVIGMSGLLLDTDLTREQRDYAETIRNSGDALLAIINDILDFSKIEAGKMELENQPFDLRECVESALDLVAARAVEKNIDLAYLIDDEVPTGIRGDVTRLRQILLNLLSNAVKFTEKGEVVLTVKQDKEKSCLLFAVRDTGIGIPHNRMDRLFTSFSQADSSTTRRYGGTGLGLAISKRLAEMMSGTMWAESGGAGKGATFSFTVLAQPATVAERKTARDMRGLQPALQGKRVLIVDDNATNRRILMLQSEKWGMLPRETESPREALRWLKRGDSFDIAVLDLQMPEMDGIMLTRELRQLKAAQSLPIILLTSLGRKEVGADDLAFSAYLTKPLKPSALFDALAGIFARNLVTPKPEGARAAIDTEMGRNHPLHILLAEDNAVNQKLALRLLEQMGYRADVASNGLEAVESVERQAYDVVLMDVQMPEMDGLDATRTIRKLKSQPQPRIVAMTANAMQGDREMCIAAGMDDYISKPIRVAELSDALLRTSVLRTSGRAQPVETAHRKSSAKRPAAKKASGRQTGPRPARRTKK